MYSIESFKKKVDMLHIELSDKQYSQYVTYYEMVVEKNKVMNLTGITEFDEFIDKHYIDSLSIVNAVDIHQVQSAIDVGTGGRISGDSSEDCLSTSENHIIGFVEQEN